MPLEQFTLEHTDRLIPREEFDQVIAASMRRWLAEAGRCSCDPCLARVRQQLRRGEVDRRAHQKCEGSDA